MVAEVVVVTNWVVMVGVGHWRCWWSSTWFAARSGVDLVLDFGAPMAIDLEMRWWCVFCSVTIVGVGRK